MQYWAYINKRNEKAGNSINKEIAAVPVIKSKPTQY
jgi:hypothetical protein